MEHHTISILALLFALCVAVFIIFRLRIQLDHVKAKYDARLWGDTEMIKRMADVQAAGPENLSLWFELSRASWCTLPRVLMQNMPKKWQAEMAGLLNELDDEFPGNPLASGDLSIHVTAKSKGRFAALPDALTNYRRPQQNVLQQWRQGGSS